MVVGGLLLTTQNHCGHLLISVSVAGNCMGLPKPLLKGLSTVPFVTLSQYSTVEATVQVAINSVMCKQHSNAVLASF